MATIGTLAIKIVAQLSDLTGQLNGLAGRVVALQQAVRALNAAWGEFASLASRAAHSLASLAEESFRSGYEFIRQGRTTGLTTQEFQVLASAANLLGVQGNKLTAWLQHASRELGQAAIAGSSAQKMFRNLGLDVEALVDMPAGEALRRILEHIRGLPTATERARAAFAVFGRSGVEAALLAGANLAALKERLAKHEALVTPEDEEKLGALNALMQDFKQEALAVGLALAEGVLPLLQTGAEYLDSWIEKEGGTREVGKSVASGLESIIALVLDIGDVFVLVWRVFEGAALQALDAVVTVVYRLLEAFDVAPKWLEDLHLWTRETLAAVEKLGDAQLGGPSPGDKFKADAERKRREKTAASALSAETKADLAEIDALMKLFDKGAKLTKDFMEPLDKLREDSLELESILKVGGASQAAVDAKLTQEFGKAFKAAGLGAVRLAGGDLTEDSRAAASAVIKFQQRPVETAEQRVERFVEEQTGLQRLIRLYTKQTADALRGRLKTI